jgi:CheY-like chemotaxis protein
VIIGHSELAIEALPPDHPVRPDLAEIQATCQRAAALTQQLLAFGRRQVLRPEVLEPSAIITGMEPMLRRLIREDIELVLLPAPAGARVKVDPGQLEQVVMNLVVNSRDAMPNGGKLTLGTAIEELDDSYAGRFVALAPGPYFMLSVTDTGIGMDRQVQARMFEPFFTTKPQGKGTGLGLATVYGIVKQSGGQIWVYSEPGHGTAVKVYLPLVASETATAAAVAPREPEAGRGETVLLVEDEAAVREVTHRILTRAGYRVVAFGDSVEALKVADRLEEPVDLILTDVVMPRMNGKELASRIAELWPDTKALYMSGYTDEAIVDHGVLEPGIHFISKPFTAAALTRKIRDVLDGAPAG